MQVPAKSNTSFAQEEAELCQLLDALPAGAYACDAAGLITYFNSRAVRLWGRVPRLNDAADRYCGSFRLYTPGGELIDHDRCWMALALHNDREYSGREIVVERPDGQRITALAHAVPMHGRDGALRGAVNVLVDLTDPVAALAALRAANRCRDVCSDLAQGARRTGEAISHAPQIDRRAAAPPDEDEGPGIDSTTGSLRVLVVDDNVDSAITMAALLGMHGHDVRTAHDGVQALEEVERFKPDVVILDIGMPRMNGYTAAARIRERMDDVQPLLIAVTGWGQAEDRHRSKAAGFDHHLVKPVDPAVLFELLASPSWRGSLH